MVMIGKIHEKANIAEEDGVDEPRTGRSKVLMESESEDNSQSPDHNSESECDVRNDMEELEQEQFRKLNVKSEEWLESIQEGFHPFDLHLASTPVQFHQIRFNSHFMSHLKIFIINSVFCIFFVLFPDENVIEAFELRNPNCHFLTPKRRFVEYRHHRLRMNGTIPTAIQDRMKEVNTGQFDNDERTIQEFAHGCDSNRIFRPERQENQIL